MIVLYILGALLAIILPVLVIPVGFTISYKESLGVIMHLFFIFDIKLVPQEKKEKSEKKTQNKKRGKKKPSEQEKRPEEKKKGGFSSLSELRGFSGAVELLFDISKRAVGTFAKILRGVTISRFDVNARIVGDNAADAAINCGRWSAILYPVIAIFLGSVRRYKQNISIEPEYLTGKNEMSILMKCRVYPISAARHIIAAAASLGIKLLRDMIKAAPHNSQQKL